MFVFLRSIRWERPSAFANATARLRPGHPSLLPQDRDFDPAPGKTTPAVGHPSTGGELKKPPKLLTGGWRLRTTFSLKLCRLFYQTILLHDPPTDLVGAINVCHPDEAKKGILTPHHGNTP